MDYECMWKSLRRTLELYEKQKSFSVVDAIELMHLFEDLESLWQDLYGNCTENA